VENKEYSNLSDDPNFHEHCPGIRFYFSDICVSNVALRLQNFKASKATGIDNIPAKVLKAASHIIAPSLTVIFKQSLKADFQSSHEAPRSSLRVMHEHFHPMTMLKS
jgi:hypothetical protein